MYALFTLLAGACQSAMGSLNRMLTDYVGMFGMSLVVHAVGGILLLLYMKLYCHEKLKISECHGICIPQDSSASFWLSLPVTVSELLEFL